MMKLKRTRVKISKREQKNEKIFKILGLVKKKRD